MKTNLDENNTKKKTNRKKNFLDISMSKKVLEEEKRKLK